MHAFSVVIIPSVTPPNFQSQILQKLYFVLNQHFSEKKPETWNGRRPDCPQKAMFGLDSSGTGAREFF